MATSISDLRQWFARGMEQGATHMIVATDTFDWDDYPVYVMKGEDVQKKVDEYRKKEMSKVMEVYCLSKPFEGQKTQGHLCWDLDVAEKK
jgi:hypothetical protein